MNLGGPASALERDAGAATDRTTSQTSRGTEPAAAMRIPCLLVGMIEAAPRKPYRQPARTSITRGVSGAAIDPDLSECDQRLARQRVGRGPDEQRPTLLY